MFDSEENLIRDADRELMMHAHLAARGIDDPRVLRAMAQVPREEFVDNSHVKLAYADRALPIECGQTISQPYTVAFMSQAARIQASDKVLEIGTGSGYGAAVLSLLAEEVHSVERFPGLAEQASERLAGLGYTNVHVHWADGSLGFPPAAPYDVIVATAAALKLPPAYARQLQEGGRIVIPIGQTWHSQTMFRYTLSAGQLAKENLGSFAFVPLVQGLSEADE